MTVHQADLTYVMFVITNLVVLGGVAMVLTRLRDVCSEIIAAFKKHAMSSEQKLGRQLARERELQRKHPMLAARALQEAAGPGWLITCTPVGNGDAGQLIPQVDGSPKTPIDPTVFSSGNTSDAAE